MTLNPGTSARTRAVASRRLARYTALISSLALLGSSLGMAGVANACTPTQTGPTVSTTSGHDAGQTMDMRGSDNPNGQRGPHGLPIITATKDNPTQVPLSLAAR